MPKRIYSGHVTKEVYGHALDRMYDLFKYGREIEIDLARKLDLARDEIMRISALCNSQPNSIDAALVAEIKQLCERALSDTDEAS